MENARELRVYVVDTTLDDCFEFITATKEEFIAEAEKQGLVYTLRGFERAFNLEDVNPSVHQVRMYDSPSEN